MISLHEESMKEGWPFQNDPPSNIISQLNCWIPSCSAPGPGGQNHLRRVWFKNAQDIKTNSSLLKWRSLKHGILTPGGFPNV